MPRDLLVTAADILTAIRHVRRVGNTVGLTDLEHREPELAGLLLEEASDLHRRLGLLHVSYSAQRRLTRQIERLGLSLILALEAAHHRLWADQAKDTPLEHLTDLPAGPSADPEA